MIVKTTRIRWKRLLDSAKNDAALLAEWSTDVGGGVKDRCVVNVEVCFSAAVELRELVIARCYTDQKTMRRGLSSSEHGALRDLVAAINEEARHPALRGVGMVGHHARCFPVWDLGDGSWSPSPLHSKFEVLRPDWRIDDEHPSTKFTIWTSDGFACESRLFDEALHWRFV